jgi:hypothetical protein
MWPETQGSLCHVTEERRRHIVRVAGGSTLEKESPRGTLPSMTILVIEIAGVVAWHTVDPEEGRKCAGTSAAKDVELYQERYPYGNTVGPKGMLKATDDPYNLRSRQNGGVIYPICPRADDGKFPKSCSRGYTQQSGSESRYC